MPEMIFITIHARTELVFQESGGGGFSPPPSVQFKLYQGEVLQYNPGASDHQNRTRHGFESTHSENPQAPTQSERGCANCIPRLYLKRTLPEGLCPVQGQDDCQLTLKQPRSRPG